MRKNVQTFKMRRIGLFLGLLATTAQAFACYNDSDTYLTELRDNLDITNAIIGRFTLYPPDYYKRRIESQTAILKKDPNNLDAYDNISVAYDRIGKSDEAIKWIELKRKHLSATSGNHLYSTEANEGTFYIVRWITGHKTGDVSDAVKAEKYIEKALKINANAHFGREFAQLYSIRAMIACGKEEEWMPKFTASLIKIADRDHIDRKKLRYGIAGMMVLGAAWDLPMMIQAIAELVPEEGQVADLCKQKLQYIGKDKYGSSDRLIADDRFIEIDLAAKYPIKAESTIHGQDRGTIRQLLRNGAEFQVSQTDWIETQLNAGKHPDNGDDFWKGYKPVPPLPKEKLATSTFWSRTSTFIGNWAMMSCGCCIFIPAGIILLIIRDRVRRALRKP